MKATIRGLRNFDSCLRTFYTILLPAESIFRNLQVKSRPETTDMHTLRSAYDNMCVGCKDQQDVIIYQIYHMNTCRRRLEWVFYRIPPWKFMFMWHSILVERGETVTRPLDMYEWNRRARRRHMSLETWNRFLWYSSMYSKSCSRSWYLYLCTFRVHRNECISLDQSVLEKS